MTFIYCMKLGMMISAAVASIFLDNSSNEEGISGMEKNSRKTNSNLVFIAACILLASL